MLSSVGRGVECLKELDDGGGGADTAGNGGGIDIESRESVHGVDEMLDIGGGDEAGACREHARGESLAVAGIVLVVAEVGVAGGDNEGRGEVVVVAEADGAVGAVGAVERHKGVGSAASAGFGGAVGRGVAVHGSARGKSHRGNAHHNDTETFHSVGMFDKNIDFRLQKYNFIFIICNVCLFFFMKCLSFHIFFVSLHLSLCDLYPF